MFVVDPNPAAAIVAMATARSVVAVAGVVVELEIGIKCGGGGGGGGGIIAGMSDDDDCGGGGVTELIFAVMAVPCPLLP